MSRGLSARQFLRQPSGVVASLPAGLWGMLAAGLVWSCPLPAAHACVRGLDAAPAGPFVVDPTRGDDRQPPAPFSAVAVSTVRRAAAVCRGEECTTTSCSHGGGEVVWHLEHPGLAAGEELGVRIVAVDGELPPRLLDMTRQPMELRGALPVEVGFAEVSALDATVQLVAVDRAGNESLPSEPLALRFSGCTTAPLENGCVDEGEFACTANACMERQGCSVAGVGRPRAAGAGLAWLAVCVWLLRRRARPGNARLPCRRT